MGPSSQTRISDMGGGTKPLIFAGNLLVLFDLRVGPNHAGASSHFISYLLCVPSSSRKMVCVSQNTIHDTLSFGHEICFVTKLCLYL